MYFLLHSCNTRKDNPLLSEPNKYTPIEVIEDSTYFSMTAHVKTTSYNGRYSPRNVGAMWIEDSEGNFVKTLRVWAANERKHLVQWKEKSNSNVVDAITGATKNSHGTREAIWNITDMNNNPVGNGTYILWVEVTEDNSNSNGKNGKLLSVEFELSDSPQTLIVEDETYFKDIQILIEQIGE